MFNNPYFLWLLDKNGLVKKEKYSKVAMLLYLKRFHSVIPLDDNRAEDGIELRSLYREETKSTGAEAPDDQCRVLELLTAFAMRIERDIFHEDSKGDRTYKWFWEMFKNLGLDKYPDNKIFYNETDSAEVDHILDVFLDRKYNKNGVGGLFPLNKTKNDQRKVELWYQMCEYANERWVKPWITY